MTAEATPLIGSVQMRKLQAFDAGRLSAAYQLNRDHLAPWEPARSDEFFTPAGQRAAIACVLAAAKDELGLHRVQAATLKHNAASRKVLGRAGFEEIGLAPSYLRIAGSWQDHILFQRLLE